MTSDLAKLALSLQNDIRAQHSAPPLEWSYELQRGATTHANTLLTRKPGEPLVAASGVKYGQNLFELKTNSDLTDNAAIERAINSWYKEREDYNPNVQSGSSGLNFSQMVWKNTKKMGLAIARKEGADGMTKIIVIAFYDPSGNFRGEFAANVTAHKTGLSSSTSTTTSNSQKNSTWNNSKSTKDNSISTRPRSTNTWSSPGTGTSSTGKTGNDSSTSTWRTTTTTTTTSRTSSGDVEAPNNFSSPGQTSTTHHVRFSSNNGNTNNSHSQPGVGSRNINVNSNLNTKETNSGANIQDLAVQLHNEYRRKHRAPSVKIDQKLNDDAQRYARSIVMGNNQTKENLGVGRNVYRLTATGANKVDNAEAVRKAIEKWYSQAGEYNWNSPLASGFGANLWTQLVWKASTSIGVGVATMGDMTAVCVLYSPPGNIASEQSYKENVSPAAY